MRLLRWSIGVFLAALLVAPLSAQELTGTVRGQVTGETSQRPIQNVMVSVSGRRVMTSADGQYELSGIPAGAQTLRARLIGYAPLTQSVTVAAGQTLDVDLVMTPQAIELAELVAVGYGEQTLGNVTGAVTNVTSEEFNAGVQVVENNEPGGKTAIRIRGTTSINASSDPLFVIDGVPVGSGSGGGIDVGRDPLNFLNSDDIESITVLRDASAAAIYGANAANGVVIIKTKSGRDAPQFEYSGTVPQNAGQLLSANTDWFRVVDRPAYGQEHSLAVSGSGESSDYRLSVNFLDQDGIIQGAGTQRISLGVNYNQRLLNDQLSLSAHVRGSRAEDEFIPQGVLSNAAQMGPTQPVSGNEPSGFYEWPGNILTSPDNPAAILELASERATTFRSIGNLQAEYAVPVIDGLLAHLSLGYDVIKAERENFTPGVLHSQLKVGTGGQFRRENPSQVNTVLDGYLNYVVPRNVGPGTLGLTAGYSYSESNAEFSRFELEGLSTDLLGPDGIPGARTTQTFLDVQDSKLISYFGRLNYNIDDRYLLAASIRRDGSSRFGPDNAWGTFPSVALAWRLSEEPFMQGLTGLSDLKLRSSWGRTGNQGFGNYQQYISYLVGDAQTQYLIDGEFVTTIRPSAVDPNIKWEATRSVNLGLDFGFSNQRFSGAIDWYDKKTTDLIFTVPVAAGTNLSNFVTTNIGSMRNRGIEFSLGARILEGGTDGLSWTANVTAAHNSNELLTINPLFGGADQILVGGIAGGVGSTIQTLTPGEPVYSFFVYEHIMENGKPIYKDVNGGTVDGVPNGVINEQDLYVDRDNDGVITLDDRRPFEDPAPDWTFGQSSYFGYRNFDLSFTLRAHLGNYVYNNVASNLGTFSEVGRGAPFNLHSSVLETGFEEQQLLSDYYVEDASFLRMDNLTLGYSFNLKGQSARAFASWQNVFTITGYSGVDPTANVAASLRDDPLQTSALNGIDNNIYPRARTFTGGLSLRF
jgi:iron complex outermembrane receptor protein